MFPKRSFTLHPAGVRTFVGSRAKAIFSMFTWGKKLVQRQSPLLASLHPRSVYIKKRTNIFDWRKPEIEDMVLKILEDNVSCPKEAISLNASTQWDLLMNHREQYVCAPGLF